MDGSRDATDGRRSSNVGMETKTKQSDDKKPRQPKTTGGFSSYDPDLYNADGTLRTCHQMPSPDMAWEEAQKARYIRTKELMARDKELSVSEIFEKS